MKTFLVDQGADTTVVNSGTVQNCLNLFGRLIPVCSTPAVYSEIRFQRALDIINRFTFVV